MRHSRRHSLGELARRRARSAGFVEWVERIVVIAAVLSIPLTLIQLRDVQHPLIAVADWMIWSVFVGELLVLWVAPPDAGGLRGRNAHDIRNLADWRAWVAVGVITTTFPGLPVLFRFARLTRLIRFARVGRLAVVGARGIGSTLFRRGMLYVGSITMGLVLAGGLLMFVLEPRSVGGDMWSGIWWAAVTAVGVGVGFGDTPAPRTVEGRLIALALMLAGVGFVTTLAASIAAYFVGERRDAQMEALRHELEELRTQLASRNSG